MLFFKELKKVIFSLSFVLLAAVLTAMYFTQFISDNDKPLSQPRPDEEYVNLIEKELPELLVPNAAKSLVSEYLQGYFSAYPFGFYKEVKLSAGKKEKMAEIITEITGISKDELDGFSDFEAAGISPVPDGNGGYTAEYTEAVLPEIIIPETLSYERFKELMAEADKLIGGGSEYAEDNLIHNFSRVPQSYENALAEYESIINEEKITPAYARLFCDYMGIILSVMPVFVTSSLFYLDRRSRISELVYSRKISSAKIVLTRYSAAVCAMLIPLAVLVIHAEAAVSGLYPDNEVNMLSIPLYAVCWLIPNILFAASIGAFFTELSSPIIAIFAQGVMWIISINGTAGGLTGNISNFSLVARHNSLYGADLFAADLDKFIFSRIFYTVLSVLLILLTILIYKIKREGGMNRENGDRSEDPAHRSAA